MGMFDGFTPGPGWSASGEVEPEQTSAQESEAKAGSREPAKAEWVAPAPSWDSVMAEPVTPRPERVSRRQRRKQGVVPIEALLVEPATGELRKVKRRSGALTVIGVILMLAIAGLGGYFIWNGSQPTHNITQEEPLPAASDLEVPLTAVPQEDLSARYEVKRSVLGTEGEVWNKAGSGTSVDSMTLAEMEPNSVLVPDIYAYMAFRGEGDFADSKYRNFQSLKIPYNPQRGVWFDGGAPVTVGSTQEQGTTLIAAHINKGRVKGSLYELYSLQGGETVWTKDAQGWVQQWQVTRLWYQGHEAFPEEYFSPEGERRLVLITCGGRVNSNGYYRENIFAVAHPVGDPIPGSELD